MSLTSQTLDPVLDGLHEFLFGKVRIPSFDSPVYQFYYIISVAGYCSFCTTSRNLSALAIASLTMADVVMCMLRAVKVGILVLLFL